MARKTRPPRVVLRPARPRDTAAIAQLEAIAFAHAGERFSRRQVAYLLRRARAVVLVAEARHGLAGWACALLRGRRPRLGARLYALAVHPDARGEGIGRRLVQRMLQDLRRAGVRRLWLEVRRDNRAAIALYQRFGFAFDRELPHYYAPGVHALRMARER